MAAAGDITVMGNFEDLPDLPDPLHLEWTSISMRISANIHYVTKRAPRSAPRQSPAVTRVEPQDLVRFEGEGGREAPEPAKPHPEEPGAQ